MKLSKQERIAAIVVLVLVILVAGVFLFVKPNIETIMSTKATLADKEREYNEAVDKAATKGQLRTDILNAYDRGKNMADMFFPELSAYEADYALQEFLDSCKANVLIEALEVGSPRTSTLSTNVFTPPSIQYALKDYVNQGKTAVADPRLARQATIRNALGDAQTIGSTTISFTVQAIEPEELLKFADEVNRYTKSENGKTIRKAILLSGVEIIDAKLNKYYEALSRSILAQSEAAAAKVFKDKTGYTLAGYSEPTTPPETPVAPGDGEGTATPAPGADQTAEVGDYVYQMQCSITFYSIERMQDPTSVLDEQDKAVNA